MDVVNYHEKISPKWPQKYDSSPEFIERIDFFRLLLSEIGSPKRILDLGCGTGELTLMISTLFPDSYVIGVDASKSMIETCNRKLKTGSQRNTRFVLCDANDYLKTGRKYDLIFSSSLFEYLTDLRCVFSLVNCSLHDKGMLVYSLPNHFSLHRRAERLTYYMFRYPSYFGFIKNMGGTLEIERTHGICGFEQSLSKYFRRTPYLPSGISPRLSNEMVCYILRKK